MIIRILGGNIIYLDIYDQNAYRRKFNLISERTLEVFRVSFSCYEE